MTMKTPEMEVVRFNESDVIVASGDPVLAHKNADVMNFGIGTVGDAQIRYHNGHSLTKNLQQIAADIDFGYTNDTVSFTNGNGQVATIGEMVRGGDADGLFSYMNGTYETNDGGQTWTWLHQ